MQEMASDSSIFGTERISRILLKVAPPVMLAQLIQALYNIVDSYFVGKYSEEGLTALSVIFPIQFVIIALAVGTGVGVNTYMAYMYAKNRQKEADEAAGTGVVLAVVMWILFSALSAVFLRVYVSMSAASEKAVEYSMTYGMIVCIGSLGIFLESIFTKVHQAGGNMKIPMAAQIAGAAVNIILDPILIFGMFGLPEMGIAGAAIATVLGQYMAAVITGIRGFRKPPALSGIVRYGRKIYRMGYPHILMQMTVTLYIVVLNVILAGFCDEAVTVLGLYYKMQTFFFIPLLSLETCIIPILSYNYARRDYGRCGKIMRESIVISLAFMLVGVVCFEFFPKNLILLFSSSMSVMEIGIPAFRIIGISFLPAVFSLMFPVFFQSTGNPGRSVLLSLTRQIFCLIPIFWLLSRVGLNYVWAAFPLAETITGGIGLFLYWKWKVKADES